MPLHMYLSTYLSPFLSICLSTSMSVYISVCLSVCVSVWFHIRVVRVNRSEVVAFIAHSPNVIKTSLQRSIMSFKATLCFSLLSAPASADRVPGSKHDPSQIYSDPLSGLILLSSAVFGYFRLSSAAFGCSRFSAVFGCLRLYLSFSASSAVVVFRLFSAVFGNPRFTITLMSFHQSVVY